MDQRASQMWDWLTGGCGFGAGSIASSLLIEGRYYGFVDNHVPLVATLSSPHPSPNLPLSSSSAAVWQV